MKKLIILSIIFSLSFLFNGCDPFEEYSINLKMDQQYQLFGAGPDISQRIDFCLNDYDDYNDNVDKIEQIKYVDAAYFTIADSVGLQCDTLSLKLYQSDGETLLFDYNVPSFVASNYLNKPLHIQLKQSEKDSLNQYLINHQQNNCFVAELTAKNVRSNHPLSIFLLKAKIEFVVELKLKP
ncbi:MAG: hypothetical protein ACUVRG_07110 [Ignavibacterium sp.]|uniref:hypothetical protein n=1 Tax=Ignavibacterium sp. TaxID=2651167 RepID=UPI00404994DD